MFSIRITLQPQRRRRQIIKKVEWILRAREREIKCTLSFPKKLLFSIDNELMETRTVRVGNISDLAGEREIREFFSFSGDIESIEIRGGASSARVAFVTFREPRALEIALLLSGATIVDRIVNISPVENYIPVYEEQTVVNEAEIATYVGNNNANVEENNNSTGGRAYVTKAHVVVSSVLAKSSALRQDAISKAKAFDEKHRLSASASEKVISLDRRIKFSEKVTVGISIVNEKVKSVDQKLQVSDKTMAAIIAAERKLNNTGTAVKANRYVTAGTAWLNGAFGKVAKAGHVAGSRTREKFQLAVSNLTAKDPVVAA